MAENLSSDVTFMAFAYARSDDPVWVYGQVVVGPKNSTIYVHCSKKINDGGITSLKYHLNGVKHQVESCKKFPLGVKWKMKQLVEDLITKKRERKKTLN